MSNNMIDDDVCKSNAIF